MDIATLVLLLWTALMLYVFGQIWLVQIVIYPLFAEVGTEDYVRYHHFYTSHIPLPVIIPGFTSFLFPLVLPFLGPETVPTWLHWLNIAAGMVGLTVTVFLEIPRHGRLERDGKDLPLIGELIRYNWPRTASITVQAIATMLMLTHVVLPG